MVLEKSLDHLLRGVFKAGNDLFMHCFMYSYWDLFFFPGYLKGGSKLWVHRKPRDKQGQQSGYRGDVKTQPGNKHPTNNRYNKTGWMKSLSGVLTWDLFPVNVKVFQEFHLKTELTLQAKVFWRYVPVLGMDGGLTLACKEFQTFYRVLCAFNPWQQFFLLFLYAEKVLVMKKTIIKPVNLLPEKVPNHSGPDITACTEGKVFRPSLPCSHNAVWGGDCRWITWAWGSEEPWTWNGRELGMANSTRFVSTGRHFASIGCKNYLIPEFPMLSGFRVTLDVWFNPSLDCFSACKEQILRSMLCQALGRTNLPVAGSYLAASYECLDNEQGETNSKVLSNNIIADPGFCNNVFVIWFSLSRKLLNMSLLFSDLISLYPVLQFIRFTPFTLSATS